ncbi:DUF2373 domain-containing protein, partial [Candidatus Bathyarchaeota archaeon]|nr:DUF2373 domain-containing protein [Candidatus Bathyarchaeota archaeon]
MEELNWAAASHKHRNPIPPNPSCHQPKQAMAARVPAWKKLGLKLKSDPQSDAPSTPAAPQRPAASFQRDAYDSPKRKREQFDSPAAWKKPKTDDRQAGPPLHRQRSVTFANGTDSNATPVQKKAKSAPKQKKPKGPKNTEPPPPPDLTVPLEYLRLWKTSRDSWKFNKIHQAHLISHAFDPSLLPAADIDTFFDYIGELKGYAKTRMVETAKNICTEDMDEEKDHFPAGTSEVESKKKQYEEIMSNLERKKSESKRKHFREVDFTSRDVDPEVARRVAKRMRAEIVVEEHG